jgi:hypothetical protein
VSHQKDLEDLQVLRDARRGMLTSDYDDDDSVFVNNEKRTKDLLPLPQRQLIDERGADGPDGGERHPRPEFSVEDMLEDGRPKERAAPRKTGEGEDVIEDGGTRGTPD